MLEEYWRKNLKKEGFTDEQIPYLIMISKNPGINTNKLFDKLKIEDNRFVRQGLVKILMDMADTGLVEKKETFWKNGKVKERQWFVEEGFIDDLLTDPEEGKIEIDFSKTKEPKNTKNANQHKFIPIFVDKQEKQQNVVFTRFLRDIKLLVEKYEKLLTSDSG